MYSVKVYGIFWSDIILQINSRVESYNYFSYKAKWDKIFLNYDLLKSYYCL